MESIWAIEIELQPAGAMTFRQMPSGLLHIMSYPFMPPTTMSGFLERLSAIAENRDWPGYGDDWFGKVKGNPKGKGFTVTLDPQYRAMGAFPPADAWAIHKTRRQGPKNFKHREFSMLLREAHKENYQLHHWDYLFCERLVGWVAAQEKAPLERLQALTNFGGKAGKEGYLIVRRVDPPRQLELRNGAFTPLGLVTPPLRPTAGNFFNLYGHWWDKSYEWHNGQKGGVSGFTQVGAWWNATGVTGSYWSWDEGVGFAAHMPDVFMQGDTPPFYHAQGLSPLKEESR